MSICITILKRKFFLILISHVSNLMHFQGEMLHFSPQKRGADKRKFQGPVNEITTTKLF